MSDQYIFFCTNIGNEKLLKEEIREFYPELKISYSQKGFITFKNSGVKYNKDSITEFETAFATRIGLCFGKSNAENIEKDLIHLSKNEHIDINKSIIHFFSINNNYVFPKDKICNHSINQYSPINKYVFDIMALNENEFWYGLHKVARKTTNYPNSNPAIKLPIHAPSRSFLKIAQTVKLFNIHISDEENWLDFGSSPGGSSYFLLEQKCNVWGVDPAKTSDEIMKNQNYTHIKSAIQDLSQEDLPDINIHWINAEININPKQTIKEVLRLAKKYNSSLKGIIVTIPIIKLDHIKNIEYFEDSFYDWGFNDISSHQVPSHKKEYVLIAKR